MNMTENKKRSLMGATIPPKTIAYDPRMFVLMELTDPGHPEYGVPPPGWYVYKRENTPELVEIILAVGFPAPM